MVLLFNVVELTKTLFTTCLPYLHLRDATLERYDVLIAGGGVAGSVAARFCARQGFKTLLLEKFKTPRNKPCSGIQFAYFEKLIGNSIYSLLPNVVENTFDFISK